MATKSWPVRVSEELGERIDAAAAEAGLKRSQWMVWALESALSDETPRSSPAGRQAKSRSHDITAAAPPVASPQGARGSAASSRASGVRAVSGRPGVRVDSVSDVRRWAAERQAKLNAAKDRSS